MAMEKLIIKIKIPPCSNELNFSCPFCDKSFRCGKALGGHKRVHFLKNKAACRNELQIFPSSNAENQEKRCPVCAQKFISEKSLHGHMRKHPDRNWRGMIPPTEQQKLENSAVSCTLLLPGVPDPVHAPPLEGEGEKDHDSSNQKHDLTLPAWPRSGRRSRYGKAPMKDDDDEHQDQVIMTMSEAYEADADKQILSVPKKKKMDLLNSSKGGNSSQGKKHAVFGNPGPRQKQQVCYNNNNNNNNNVVVDYNKARSSGENDEFVGAVMAALSENQETRNQSTVFEFDLNELPREWNDDA